jgi:putative phosphoribosyl transferase
MQTRFQDRREGGRHLAQELRRYARRSDVVVLALPRGGVPVGYEIALRLGLPLDVFLVRKLGVPGHEEYAMGAMASGGVIFLNEDVIRQLRISEEEIQSVIDRESHELDRREEAYNSRQPRLDVKDCAVILVDDGLATGSTMKAAVQAVREKQPKEVVVAVPVAPSSTARAFQNVADEFVCVMQPENFSAVGEWYVDFDQTTDEEVRDLLQKAAENFQATFPVVHSPLV